MDKATLVGAEWVLDMLPLLTIEQLMEEYDVRIERWFAAASIEEGMLHREVSEAIRAELARRKVGKHGE